MSETEMKLVVVGAAGRMGQTLIRTIHATAGVRLHAAIERSNSPFIGRDAGEIAGLGPIGIPVTDKPLEAFVEAEGVLDFTAPAGTVEFAGLAAQARIVHVIGTTGCSADDEAKIRAAARHARVVKSGNMSLGVNLLGVLTETAARALGPTDWDIEIVEMHHKHKVDAPSGTALLIGEAAAKGRGIDLADHSVKVCDGHTGPRPQGTIGFATLRGGSVIGEHSVILAGEGEMVTLSHSATDRSIFARGAVSAALWARNQKPGFYSMLDVVGLTAMCSLKRKIEMSGTLVLVRHGQSEWNLKNLFTGWRDPDLTELGVTEAKAGGKALAEYGIKFDIAFTSVLIRAQRTCQMVLDAVGQSSLETIFDQALNERDYGDLSGLNKDDARAKWGEEQVHIWRRSYDVPPPGGESLRDTGARVWPYYLTEILPRVLAGEKVLVAAHGNSLRSLVMVLDRLTKEQVLNLNLATGVPMVYKLKADSTVASKEVLGDMSAAH